MKSTKNLSNCLILLGIITCLGTSCGLEVKQSSDSGSREIKPLSKSELSQIHVSSPLETEISNPNMMNTGFWATYSRN